MSDTGSHAPAEPRRRGRLRCCLLAVAALLLPSLALAGYAGWVARAARQPQPLPFPAFSYMPLERSLLTAKFEFLELPSRLLTGGAEPVTVWLSDRELNALLFGEAGHRDGGEKARVLVEGDALRLEHSRPAADVPQPDYYNLRVLLRVNIGPEGVRLDLPEASIGSYELGGVARGLLRSRLEEELRARRQRDARLGRIRELSVEGGRVRVVYQPEPR